MGVARQVNANRKDVILASIMLAAIGLQVYAARSQRYAADAGIRAQACFEAARTYQRVAAYFGQKALRCEKMYYDLIRS